MPNFTASARMKAMVTAQVSSEKNAFILDSVLGDFSAVDLSAVDLFAVIELSPLGISPVRPGEELPGNF
jgi:hypothetical protein